MSSKKQDWRFRTSVYLSIFSRLSTMKLTTSAALQELQNALWSPTKSAIGDRWGEFLATMLMYNGLRGGIEYERVIPDLIQINQPMLRSVQLKIHNSPILYVECNKLWLRYYSRPKKGNREILWLSARPDQKFEKEFIRMIDLFVKHCRYELKLELKNQELFRMACRNFEIDEAKNERV